MWRLSNPQLPRLPLTGGQKIKNLVEDMVYGDKEAADEKQRPGSRRSMKDPPRPAKDQPRKGDETDSEAVSRFRWSLYQKQVQPSALGGRCQVSRRAPERNEEQHRCPHQYDELEWRGNGEAIYARCKVCKLKHVIYYDTFHEKQAFVADLADKTKEVFFLETRPGEALGDSGCKSSVGGSEWHEQLRQEVQARGYEARELKECEYFQAQDRW